MTYIRKRLLYVRSRVPDPIPLLKEPRNPPVLNVRQAGAHATKILGKIGGRLDESPRAARCAKSYISSIRRTLCSRSHTREALRLISFLRSASDSTRMSTSDKSFGSPPLKPIA